MSVPMTGWLVLALLVAYHSVAAQFNRNAYCSISSDHTLCRFQGRAPSCGRVLRAAVTPGERRHIVQLHNQLRSRVAMGREMNGSPGPQPSASNMRQLQWDDEVAAVAQRWAEQCQFQHDCGVCRQVPRFHVGQNLFASIHTGEPRGADWNDAIQSWYEEVKDFASFDVYRFPSTQVLVGHYTAMVWATTSVIGCGYVSYQTGSKNNRLYICNYAPTGNVLSTPVYRRGAACSACPAGTRCSVTFRGLCVSDDQGLPPQAPPQSLPQAPPQSLPQAPPQSLPQAPPQSLPQAPPQSLPQAPPQSLPQAPPQSLPQAPPQSLPQAPMQSLPQAPPQFVSSVPQVPLSVPTGRPTPVSVSQADAVPVHPALGLYSVMPDSRTGCFGFLGYIICLTSRGSVLVIKAPAVSR